MAPVVFLISFEIVRLAIIDAAFEDLAANLVAAGVAAAAAVAFGVVLFFYLEGAQREVRPAEPRPRHRDCRLRGHPG